MKPFKTLIAFLLGSFTMFSISSANAGVCSSNIKKKVEFKSLSDDKKCIDKKEKELLQEVEA